MFVRTYTLHNDLTAAKKYHLSRYKKSPRINFYLFLSFFYFYYYCSINIRMKKKKLSCSRRHIIMHFLQDFCCLFFYELIYDIYSIIWDLKSEAINYWKNDNKIHLWVILHISCHIIRVSQTQTTIIYKLDINYYADKSLSMQFFPSSF